jgi:hypothetical protein
MQDAVFLYKFYARTELLNASDLQEILFYPLKLSTTQILLL